MNGQERVSSPDPVPIVYTVDRSELARRGRLGGIATRERHDAAAITRPAREAFLSRFQSDEERTEYFRELGRRSAVARLGREAVTA